MSEPTAPLAPPSRALVHAVGRELVRATGLHDRSLVRAAAPLGRWATPDGGVAWRRDLGVASYRPLLVVGAALVAWVARPSATGTVHDRVAAFDPLTGERLWELPASPVAPAYGGRLESAVAAGDLLVLAAGTVGVAGDDEGTIVLQALDAATGDERWSRDVPGLLVGGVDAPGAGLVVANLVRDGVRHRVGLDSGTGATRWDVAADDERRRRPGRAVVPLLDQWGSTHDVVGCDPATGETVWARAPAVLAGRPEPESGEYVVWARSVDRWGAVVLVCLVESYLPEGRWPVAESVLTELDLATGYVRWQARWDRKLGDELAVDDELVVVHHASGFEAFDRASGRLRWRAGAPIDRHFHRPVIAGRVVAYRDGAELVLHERRTGRETWRLAIGDEHDDVLAATPVVFGTRIVCRVDGEIVAVDPPARLTR